MPHTWIIALLLLVGTVSGQIGFNSPFASLSIDGGVEKESDPTDELLPGSGNVMSGTFGIPNPARFFNYYKPKPVQRCPVEQISRNSVIRVEFPSTVSGARQPSDTTCGLQFSGGQTFRYYNYNRCTPQIECPCFSIPSNNGCLDNFLEISDQAVYRRRFCGTNAPNGVYLARSGVLQLRSRGGSYTCFVTCGSNWNRPSGFVCPTETGATASPTPTMTASPGTGATASPTQSPATGVTGTGIPIVSPGPDQ